MSNNHAPCFIRIDFVVIPSYIERPCSTWPKFKTKIFWEREELLRWNKKHFSSILKGFSVIKNCLKLESAPLRTTFFIEPLWWLLLKILLCNLFYPIRSFLVKNVWIGKDKITKHDNETREVWNTFLIFILQFEWKSWDRNV